MKIYYLTFILLIFASGTIEIGLAQSPVIIKESVMLPDGTLFPFWDDQTLYKKVYYVDQNNPKASDQNTGTESSPFLTINRAARILAPGEKVIIKKGIYRENVQPARGGDNQSSMICYEASPGVILSGSEILKERWVTSRTPYKPSQVFSNKLWMTTVSQSYFKEQNPFLMQNAGVYEMEVMNWAKNWTDRVPYTLMRGLIFQDGVRLTQLAAYEDIVKLRGSYWVDTIKNNEYAFRIHIHPFADKDPNDQVMEITTRQSPFNPGVKGINYIRVRGFIIEQVGNGFQRTGKGALSTFGGSHWIIEDNIIRGINSVAVEIAALTDEHAESDRNREAFEKVSGRHIVRNNTIYDCGTGCIQGLLNIENLVENNHLYNTGWQQAEFYWETAAIKLLLTHNCLIRKNHIHDVEAADGIWLDFENINTRVTRNLIYNIDCDKGGIFIEASYRPVLVDHNLLWNCRMNSLYQHDCDSVLFVHNIVGKNSRGSAIMMSLNKGRRRPGGGFFTAKNNTVLYNLLVDNNRPFSYSDTINISDYNLISSSGGKDTFDWSDWRRKGFDKNTRIVNIKASFNPSDLVFTIKTNGTMPQVKKLPYIYEDLIGRKYDKGMVKVGGLINDNETLQLANYFRIK